MPRKIIKSVISLSLIAFLAACVSEPVKEKKEFEPPVYPKPPDQPRFVYERTLYSSASVEDLTESEQFKLFATGAKRTSRGMVKPWGIAAYKGRVYVSDTIGKTVTLFDIPGGRFKQIGTGGKGMMEKPTDVFVSNKEEVYVTDSKKQRVIVFNLEGDFLRTIGSDEYLTRPNGVVVSNDGKTVYVVDTGFLDNDHHRVQVFDAATGNHLKTIGSRGKEGGKFNIPIQIDINSKGEIYIVDTGNFRVQQLDGDGNFIRAFGKAGRFPGDFSRPKSIAIDPDDNVYVSDSSFSNVQIFNANGELLMFIGEQGGYGAGGPGIYSLIAGVEVDEDGRLYVVDQFYRKIDVFRPYRLKAEEGFAANPALKKTAKQSK